MEKIRRIDVHSHINFNAYKDDAEAVIRRSLDDGTGMFAVGSQSTTSERAVEYAEKYDGIWAVVGLHPTHLFEHEVDEDEVNFKSREEKFDVDFYRALARRSSKVVAIGECGLDYFHMPSAVSPEVIKEKQEQTFRAHCDLAYELGLPIMVHCRDAHNDLAKILEEYAAQGKILRGDIHCFTGSSAEAERYIKLGFYISFTGIITFPPKAAEIAKGETLQDVVKKVPLDRLLIETDAPYLSPVPFRGKQNEPSYVKYVGVQVANLKGLLVEEVETQTLANTRTLFGI